MEEDNHRKNISGSSDLIFTNAKVSSFFRNLNKINIAVEKVSKQKVMKVRSHQDSLWMLRMLIIFFKLIGLATFIRRIDTSKKRTLYTFQYSEFGIIYNAVLISLMLASNYLSIPYRIKVKYENKSNLTVAIELVQTILGTIVICTILLFYCVDQRSFVRMINRMTDIEHEIDHLYRLHSPLHRQRVLWTTIFVCILNGCLLIVLLISEILAFNMTPISWLTDVLPTFHVGWLIIQYFLLVTIIQADFIDVNRAIQTLIRTSDLRMQSFYQTRRVIVSNSTVNQLLQLRDVHCHLCEISENVSDFYSLPILFGVTFLFLSLIYNGYYLLSPLLMSDEVLEYMVLGNTIIWLIYLICPIFLLTNRITRIMNEVG